MPAGLHVIPPAALGRRQHATSSRPGWWVLRLLGLVGFLLVAGGCQAEPAPTGQDTAPPTTSTPASPPSATPSLPPAPQPPSATDPQAGVLAAYARFWEVYVQAAASADPNHPALAEVATGQALAGLRVQLTLDRRRGIVARGQPVRTATRITRLTARRAELTECLDSNRWLAHDAQTGELRDTPSGIIRRVHAVLTRTPAGWKVAELNIGTTGEPACGD